MAIKKKQLEADNLKRQTNALQKNSVQKNQTAEQRAIAHSNQSLNRTNNTSGHKPKSKLKTQFNSDNEKTDNFSSSDLQAVEFDSNENVLYENQPLQDDISDFSSNDTFTQNTFNRTFKSTPLTSNYANRSSGVHHTNTSSNNRSLKLKKSTVHKIHNENTDTKFFKSNTDSEKISPQKSESSFKKSTHSNVNFTKAEESTSNSKFKQRKIISSVSSVSSVLKDSTTETLKSGVENYKNELEKNDVGVQVAGQSLTAANKVLKLHKRVITKLRSNKTPKIISSNDLTTNSNKSVQSFKLIKRNRELGQAQRELKIKKPQLKTPKSNLQKKNNETRSNFTKKSVVIPLSTLKKGAANYKSQLERDDTGVEVVGKSSTLVKQSVVSIDKARKKLKNPKKVGATTKSKLNSQSFKLKKKNNAVKKATPNNKLQKKAIKKSLVNRNRKSRFLGRASGVIGNANAALVNFIKNFSFVAIKKAILGKVAAIAGGGLTVLVPVFIVMGLIILIIAMFGAGGSHQQQVEGTIGVAQNLSPEVEQWRELVTTEANAQGMGNYVDLILAIIQVESGGRGTRDIMQSSESAGYPRNYYQTEAESVRQGISYLKSIVSILQSFNKGYENNARLIAQSYNFGSPFANYVGNRGGNYDLSMAEDYSRTVVAPSLGNFNGETYSYVNQVSQSFGKPYLYRNGGNFFYGELVGQYLGRPSNIDGDFAIVLAEVEKYNGWSYVWGGKSPQSGFDCSGLVAWGLKQIGINLPSPAANQYNMTVPISESEARPGDLIFFKGTYGGPNHVSHVGFYIDENTMYDSNGSGVGYHNWKSPYWQKYKPEIRRIVQ